MMHIIKAVKSLFSKPAGVLWLSLEDRLNREVILYPGSSKVRRIQIRQWCQENGISKPWSIISLRQRKWEYNGPFKR